VSDRDLDLLLTPNEYLADDVINNYIKNLLRLQTKNKFLYIAPQITQQCNEIGYRNIFAYCQKFDAEWQYVIIPININTNHWIVSIFEKANNSIKIIDPLKFDRIRSVGGILSVLWYFLPTNTLLDRCPPNLQMCHEHPLQMDSYNCGTHICKIIEHFIKDPYQSIDYECDADNMYQHRLKIYGNLTNAHSIDNIPSDNKYLTSGPDNEMETEKLDREMLIDECQLAKISHSENLTTSWKVDVNTKGRNKDMILSIPKVGPKEPEHVKLCVELVKSWVSTACSQRHWEYFEEIVEGFLAPLTKLTNGGHKINN